MHKRFLEALSQGFVPAGEDAQAILYETERMRKNRRLMDALRKVSNRYDIKDFNSEKLKADIEHDLKLLQKILELVAPITPEQDAKLQKLKEAAGQETSERRQAADFHPIRGHGEVSLR